MISGLLCMPWMAPCELVVVQISNVRNAARHGQSRSPGASVSLVRLLVVAETPHRLWSPPWSRSGSRCPASFAGLVNNGVDKVAADDPRRLELQPVNQK